jgi:hypothetical protein
VFLPGKPFLPSLMSVGKAGAYLSEAPFGCSTLVLAPGLTQKHQTRLERLTRDKHSSLLRKFVNYDRKSFMIQTPGPNVIKLFTAVIYECS